jgi:hypothetical protein
MAATRITARRFTNVEFIVFCVRLIQLRLPLRRQ